MRGRVYRPRRSLRIEIAQLVATLALPVAIFYSFPYKALSPSTHSVPQSDKTPASCAFVTLDGDEERRIVAAARSAWQVSAESVRRLRLDIFAEEIPEAKLDPVADISIRTRTARSAPFPKRDFSPPTDYRAPLPEMIERAGGEMAPVEAFTKDELLRLD